MTSVTNALALVELEVIAPVNAEMVVAESAEGEVQAAFRVTTQRDFVLAQGDSEILSITKP